jgi:hypothetical protein
VLNLLASSVGLLAGIAFMAADSAESRIVEDCFMSGSKRATLHYGYAYLVWGAAAGILLSVSPCTEGDASKRALVTGTLAQAASITFDALNGCTL